MQIYSKNDWNDFLVFIKFVIILNIIIAYDWNKFVGHVESLIIIISQMVVFGAMTISMW